MFFYNPNFYYVSIALQAICAIHCIRKGTQNKWIWIIVFLPIVGSIAYIFTEMFNGRDIKQVQSGMGVLLNPGGRIKQLEANLHFSDTFNNRVALADAYLDSGYTNKAIQLYESSLTGPFTEHEHVLTRLILAYYVVHQYDDIVRIAPKISRLPQFNHSRAHTFYAVALSYTGNQQQAEKEFLALNGRFSQFESRYQYGLFLQREGRYEDARQVFNRIVGEASHLSGRERRDNRIWFTGAKEELKKVS